MTARKAGVIRVFVASPRDLEVERDSIGAAIDELNLSVAPSRDMRLELVRWETHITPELGNDPQEIINRQLRDDYEVFIGLLWTRFGSPTPRAESGTVEEFERAKARWAKDPESVSVKFYFKEEMISPNEIEPDQLARVQAFRRELGTSSIYGTFVSADDLGRLVRIHLSRHLLGGPIFRSDGPGVGTSNPPSREADVVPNSSAVRAPENGVEVHDDGLLDLVEQATYSFSRVREILDSLTGGLVSLTLCTREATNGIEQAKGESGWVDYGKVKGVVNELADKMNAIAIRFEADVPEFRDRFAEAMDAFIKGTEVSADFGEEGLAAVRGSRESVSSLATESQSALEVVEGLRASTDQLPRVTTQFNRARKRLSSILAAVHREFSSANTLVKEASAVVDRTLAKLGTQAEEEADSSS